MPLPEAFRDRLQAILPAEHFAACWQSLATEQPTAFRANALKGTPDALVAELTAEGFALTPLTWKADAFVVPVAQRRALTECVAYRESRLYIQNPLQHGAADSPVATKRRVHSRPRGRSGAARPCSSPS